jgi:hypothetical protein
MIVSTFILTRAIPESEDSFGSEMESINAAAAKVELAPRGRLVFFTGMLATLALT